MGCKRDGRHRMGLGVARASTALDVPIVMSAASEAPTFSVRRIVFVVIALGAISVLSLIVAGVTSLISLADRIHPVAGSVVFWIIVLAAGFFALYCVIAYARLPAALIPPEEEFGPKHDEYLEALRVRLAANPRTRGEPLTTNADIENAIGVLSAESD